MIGWSLLVGLLGLLGMGTAAVRLANRAPAHRPEFYWFLGLVTLLPAWLIAFLTLLDRASGPRPEKALSASWILSSSAALAGAIATDAAVRRLRDSGRGQHPVTCWLLGVAAMVLAWAIALLVLALIPASR